MAFFDDFTTALKQKWLQYFQLNHGWMTLQMELESVKTPDGGRRPPSYLILGVLNALEPKLAQLMLPFAKLNPDADALIDVLELNFDPDIALGNRPADKAASKPAKEAAPVALIEEESEEESLEVAEAGFGDMGLDEFGEEETEVSETEEETDAFGAMDLLGDLEEETSESSEESLADLGDISLDAWGEETSESSDEALADLDDMTFEGFGETSKESEEEADAFGDMTFEELGEVDLNIEEADEWK